MVLSLPAPAVPRTGEVMTERTAELPTFARQTWRFASAKATAVHDLLS